MANIFTTKFLIVITAVLILSSAFSYTFLSPQNTDKQTLSLSPAATTSNQVPTQAHFTHDAHDAFDTNSKTPDQLIDQALEYSLNGAYDQSFPIFKRLTEQNVIRAKLYLAVAYYHGHGVPKNKQNAKSLFLELQKKNYETGIVHTYLNLIAYSES